MAGIDTHPHQTRTLDQEAAEAGERLWAEYRSFALDRENDPEVLLDGLREQLEELDGSGAGASPGAVALRRFLEEVACEEGP